MNSWRRCWIGVTTIALIALPLAPVHAEIPADAVAATSALTQRQQTLIEETVSKLADQLVKDSDADVIKTRSDLLDPLDRAPKDRAFFKIAYSAAVVTALTNASAMKSPRMIVRLNAMIIVAQLFDPTAVRLINIGLADANPAVRYWAAKAAGQLAQAKADENNWLLPPGDQKNLLDTLTSAASKESSPDALQQELKSMGRVNLPDAVMRLLDTLNARVAQHAATPNLPMIADTGGLQELYVDQVQQVNANTPADPAMMRKLALVSYRYLAVIAHLLVDTKPSPDIEGQYWEMLKICDVALPWAAEKVASNLSIPGSLKEFIDAKDRLGIQLRSEDWKKVMTDKLRFTPEELAVK